MNVQGYFLNQQTDQLRLHIHVGIGYSEAHHRGMFKQLMVFAIYFTFVGFFHHKNDISPLN